MEIIDKKRKEIDNYLSSISCESKLDKLNVCAYIYNIITEATKESQSCLFEYFLSTSDYIEGTKKGIIKSYYNDEERKKLEKEYGSFTDQMFEMLLKKNLNVHDFYTELWRTIINTPIYQNKDSKVFALYYIWIDARIPYFYLDNGLEMDNSEFALHTNAIINEISKARFILRTNYYTQRTARASALLKLLNSMENDDEKCVLLAHILSISSNGGSEERLRHLLSQVLSDYSE